MDILTCRFVLFLSVYICLSVCWLSMLGRVNVKKRVHIPQQALYWQVPGYKRGPGRPRANWRSTVNQDLHKMGLSWEEAEVAALDRHGWRRRVDQRVQLDAGWIKVKVIKAKTSNALVGRPLVLRGVRKPDCSSEFEPMACIIGRGIDVAERWTRIFFFGGIARHWSGIALIGLEVAPTWADVVRPACRISPRTSWMFDSAIRPSSTCSTAHQWSGQTAPSSSVWWCVLQRSWDNSHRLARIDRVTIPTLLALYYTHLYFAIT